MSFTTLLFLILIGLAAGLLSGFIGVGGGIIIIPLLMIFLGMSQHQAQGTSLAVMLPPIGILAAWNYHKAGFVDWKFALIISATFIIGGYISSNWAVNIDVKSLKKFFGIMLLIGGLKLIFGK
ncbi:MAG: permease [Flavobacteriales bacterium]|nr:permease [Flavobacteriales bacterium]MBH83595.1 permease [Flavobacteriales bacterium]|tara:strand:+ start:413 stop:781 length:369 start_codon:yes stop_codon:yes gene_type:complete